MKILTVLSTFPPHFYGGGEVAALNLSEWLSENGQTVAYVTAADVDEPELHGQEIKGSIVWRLRFPRPYAFWNHAKTSRWLKPLWYIQDHFDPRNRKLMAKVLDEFKPDLVQFHVMAGIGHNTAREVARRKIPAVYFLHDLSLACLWGSMFKDGKVCTTQCGKCKLASKVRFGDVASIKYLGFVSPSQANLDKATSVLPLSNYKTAAIFNPNKHVPAETPRTEADHVRFLYVGRLHKTKGVDFLLGVLEKLRERFTFTIDILGEGAEAASLQERFGHHEWIGFRGHVSEQDVSNYMTRTDILCIPSIWSEPLGGVVVHALSIGLPAIGSNTGGIPEMIEHDKNGLLVAPDNAVAWEHALESVLAHPEKIKTWGTYAKTHAQKFDQDFNGVKILKFFQEIGDLKKK